ncbi:MAG: fibronectin type III domain-containing protein [Thermoplasmata archaeon]
MCTKISSKVLKLTLAIVICLSISSILSISTIPVKGAQNDAGIGGDAGNDFSTAVLIGAGKYNGTLSSTDLQDWYKFFVEKGTIISVLLTVPENANFDIVLFDSNNTTRASSKNSNTGYPEQIYYTSMNSENWTIKISAVSNYGDYTFTLELTCQNDAGSGRDAGDTKETAINITSGEFGGYLLSGDIKDQYNFSAVTMDVVSVLLKVPPKANFDFALYDPDGNKKTSSEKTDYGAFERICIVADSSGYWSVVISTTANYGNYTFILEANKQNDSGSGGDAGNSIDAANTITPGEYNGFLMSTDIRDWYKFHINESEVVSLLLKVPPIANFDVKLYDPSFTEKDRSENGQGSLEHIFYGADVTGDWLVCVYIKDIQESNYGNYTLILETTKQNDAGQGRDTSNSMSGAYNITPGTYEGFLIGGDTQDWYKFFVNNTDVISTLLLVPKNANFDIALYDSSGTNRYTSSAGTGWPERAYYTADSTGHWYAKISSSQNYGNYTLKFEINSTTGSEDANRSIDANDSISSPLVITPGEYTGHLNESDIHDYYSFSAQLTQVIDVTIAPDGFGVGVYLYNPSGVEKTYQSGGSTPSRLVYSTDTPGNWSFRVSRSWGSGFYKIMLSVTRQNDACKGGDANNTLFNSTLVGVGDYWGELFEGDTKDCYSFFVDKGQVIDLVVIRRSTDFQIGLSLYDPSLTEKASYSSGTGALGIVYSADTKGNWSICITALYNPGKYRFNLSIRCQNDGNLNTDAGDIFTGALAISQGNLTGEIYEGDTSDYYYFVIDEKHIGEVIEATVFPTTWFSVSLLLYNPAEKLCTSQNMGNLPSHIEYAADSSGKWVIKVNREYNWGAYKLNFSVHSQNDSGSNKDAGNTIDASSSIATGVFFSDSYLGDYNDCYSFQAERGQIIDVVAIPLIPEDRSRLRLYDPQNNEKTSRDSTGPSQILYSADSTGLWRLRTYTREDWETWFTPPIHGTYKIVLLVYNQSDAGANTDAGNSFNTAVSVIAGNYTGRLYSGDDVDYYSIHIDNIGDQINVTATSTFSESQIYLRLYDSTNREREYRQGTSIGFTSTADMEGDWRIAIGRGSGLPVYDMNITILPNTPPGKVGLRLQENSTNYIRVEWNTSQDSDFKKYELHKSAVSGFVPNQTTLVYTVDNRYSTTYSVSNLMDNTIYYFKLVVYDSGGFYNISDELNSSTTNNNPSPINIYGATEITATTVNLSWSQSFDSDFEKYDLYKSTFSGFWPSVSTHVSSIGDKRGTYYLITGLKENTQYFFKVVVYDSGGLFSTSNEVSIRTEKALPLPVTLYLSTTNASSVGLNWSKNEDSDFKCYEVHKSSISGFTLDSMTTLVTTIYSQSYTFYTVSNLKENTNYYFKIVVYDQDNLKNVSNEVTTKTSNGPPSLITFNPPSSITTDSMVLTWSKCEDSDFQMYEIYKSTDPNFTASIATSYAQINDQTTTSRKISGLGENTDYYFRIVTYDTSGLSTSSEAISGKTSNAPPTSVKLEQPSNETITPSSVTLSWWASKDADFQKYEIHVSTTPGFAPNSSNCRAEIRDQKITTHCVDGLNEGTEYFFKILVYDTGGLYATLNEVKVTTALIHPNNQMEENPNSPELGPLVLIVSISIILLILVSVIIKRIKKGAIFGKKAPKKAAPIPQSKPQRIPPSKFEKSSAFIDMINMVQRAKTAQEIEIAFEYIKKLKVKYPDDEKLKRLEELLNTKKKG